MRIMTHFDPGSAVPNMVEFVDQNKVAVSYNLNRIASESFGYRMSFESLKESALFLHMDPRSLDHYSFDVDYFHRTREDHAEWPEWPIESVVWFRLMAERKPDLYLGLYNYHNGYCAHRFTMTSDGIPLRIGEL